jgi:hypothetical protein
MGELFGSHGQVLAHNKYLHRRVGPEVVSEAVAEHTGLGVVLFCCSRGKASWWPVPLTFGAEGNAAR